MLAEVSLNRLLTIKELATYLQLDPNTVYRWCRENMLPAVKMGKEWRVSQRDLDAFVMARRNAARYDSLEAILEHQMSPPEHVVVLLTDPQRVYELEVTFFRAALDRGHPILKACWWQNVDDVRRRLIAAGIPVADLEASGRFVIWDMWSVYRRGGADGVLELFASQVEAWNDRAFWGSGSHLVDEWSGSFPALLDYEARLHPILSRSTGVVLCPCVSTPTVAEGAAELLNLVPHHSGALFMPSSGPVLARLIA
jgi:excisionase family DNA binding protein